MIPVFGAVEYWHWWALGGALLMIEPFAPGFVFMWLGIAAGLVGCLLWLWPGLGPDFQVLVFAALSVASVIGWRRWQTAHPAATDQPHLNRRGAQYVGRQFDLVEPITNGRGRIKLGDSSWTVTGPDLPAGQTVEVIGADGVVLQVRPLSSDDHPLRTESRPPGPTAAPALEGDAPSGQA